MRKWGPPTTPAAQQPETFSPPLAMQRAIWDSILNGNFIDAKIFAYSRRSREPGRVDTPKALFVNTHVLATACSYFRSTFNLSDGIETGLTAGFPPGLDAFIDVSEENDSDSDYDPTEEALPPTQAPCPGKAPEQAFPERSVKAYLIKYTAYRTLHAIIWYIYSGDVVFSHNGPPGSRGASVKSIYRFADEHGIDDLKKLAFVQMAASINRLKVSKLMEEAFSIFASRYPELHCLYITRLRSEMSSAPSFGGPDFQQQISRYFSGELPHSKDLLTSLLQTLMSDAPAFSIPRGISINNAILRASHPWPVRTKNALRISLDRGTFEDIRIMVPSDLESTKYPVYLAGAVDQKVGSSISRLCRLGSNSQSNAETSLITWRAVAYYMYADCISFKPLGPESDKVAPAYSPPDALFRGYPCSLREVYDVARKLGTCEALVDLAINTIVLGMTPDNVFEEMFCKTPPPAKIIDRGARIIWENRKDNHIRSQLQKILEDAASGDNSMHAAAFSACFNQLFQSGWRL